MKILSALRRLGLGLTILLSGCMDLPPDGGDPDPSVSNPERLASLDRAQQAIAQFDLNGDPAVSDQIAAALSAMAEFEKVTVYAGSVVARFTDGEVLVVVNSRPSGGPPASELRGLVPSLRRQRPAGASSLTHALYRRPGATTVKALPSSKKVVLINAMGTAYTDDTPQLRDWFTAPDPLTGQPSGYEVTIGDGTIEGFRNEVKDIAVLYVNSHGAPIPASAVADLNNDVLNEVGETPRPTAPLEQSDGNDHFFIWTKTVINDQTIEKYRTEVRTGRLAYMIAENDMGPKSTFGRHFCVTETFVQDNWTCGANALIYMDCCWSSNSLLSNVCIYSPVNAALFIGWSAPTFDPYSVPSERYFFDRLLGGNRYLSTAVPQRPYSVVQVQEAMKNRTREGDSLKLDQSVTSQRVRDALGIQYSELTFIFSIEDLLLRPAIEDMDTGSVGETKTVTLNGAFGDEQGTVTMAGTPLPVREWTPHRITCDLADGASGAVIVTADQRVSNPRTMTQWDLTLRRLFMDFPTQAATDCPSCFYEANVRYTFRADCAPVRQIVDGPLIIANVTGAADTGTLSVTNAGGSYAIGQGTTITLAPNPDHGADFIGTCVGFLPPLDNNYFGACFFLDGQASQFRFSPTLFAEALVRNYTGGAFDGFVDPYQVSYFGNQTNNELILPISPNFNIEAGTQSTGPNSYFEWDGASAQNPPNVDDPK